MMILFMMIINLFSEQDPLSFLNVSNFLNKVIMFFFNETEIQIIELFSFRMLIENKYKNMENFLFYHSVPRKICRSRNRP